jgi:tight adherence protein B
MWLIPVTFALTFALVAGIYWAIVLRPEQAAHDSVTSRLRGPKTVREDLDAKRSRIVREDRKASSIPIVESLLQRTGGLNLWLQRQLDTADVSMSVGRFILTSLLVGFAVYAFFGLYLRQFGVGLLFGVICGFIPMMYVRYQRDARVRKLEELFPEAVDLIARALRAGHGLTAGLGMVAEEIPNPIAREFRLLHDWQNFGMPLNEALVRFTERVPLLDAKFFVTAVLTQREAGGNLSEVLDNLSKVIRDRFRVRRQIRVLSAHGRITGAVLSGLPPALAAYLFMIRPGYISELSNDPLGVRMVLGALVLQVAGMLIIRRLVDIEY